MSNNKSQISPIPPEGYGDRFVKFISGLTMTKEEQERDVGSGEQLDGSINATALHTNNLSNSRPSYENSAVEKAEKSAMKTEKEGATEEPQHDRTLSTMRSPSAERSSGLQGATLPVVEEDGETGTSREDLNQDERAIESTSMELPGQETKCLEPMFKNEHNAGEGQLPSIPNFNRLSMGMTSTPQIVAADK